MPQLLIPLLLCASSVCGAQEESSYPELAEVSGEGVYYLEGRDDLETAKNMALQSARSEAIAKVFGTTVASSTLSSSYVALDGEERNSFSAMMRTLQAGVWVKDLDAPEVVSFIDEDGSFGFKATVRGLARKIKSTPVETRGHVLVGEGSRYAHETESLRAGEEFYFGFTAATDGYLAIYLVDEDEMVCKAGPAGNRMTPMRVTAGVPLTVRDESSKNVAFITHPEDWEVYNRVIYVFSPREFTLPLGQHSYATGYGNRQDAVTPGAIDFARFHTWLQDMTLTDPQVTLTWQNLCIRR